MSLVETAIRAIRFSFHRLLPHPYYNPAEPCFSSKAQTEDVGFQGIAIEAPIVKDPNSILPTFVVSLVEESTEKMPIPLSGIDDPSPLRFAVAGEARDKVSPKDPHIPYLVSRRSVA